MRIIHGTVFIGVILHCWFADMMTASFSLDYWSEKLLELKYRLIVMSHHVERKGTATSKIPTIVMWNLISASWNRTYDTREDKSPNWFLDDSWLMKLFSGKKQNFWSCDYSL